MERSEEYEHFRRAPGRRCSAGINGNRPAIPDLPLDRAAASSACRRRADAAHIHSAEAQIWSGPLCRC